MLPSIFRENLFDDMFNDMLDMVPMFGRRNPKYGISMKNTMKTDVRETEQGYEIDVDLPGFDKEDVQVQLKNGYLIISASREEKSEEDGKGEYIRKERYTGSCCRSFYVGNDIRQEDVSAKFEKGILNLTLPKKDEKALLESSNIKIE